MKLYAIALVALAACSPADGTDTSGGGSGTSTGTPPPLVGTEWETFSSDGSSAQDVQLNADNTFLLQFFAIGSVIDDEAQEGTYSIAGSTINFVPTAWTCTGSDPAFAATFVQSGTVLTLTDSSGVPKAFNPATSQISTNTSLTFGCFTSSGFSASPLVPVMN
jgi:hypothetical protein